ncbi:hypothetical protein M8J75_003330 [Diaphorina citri]|nr:hypothetical protein M8J75_003330 [Diaphorina citri]
MAGHKQFESYSMYSEFDSPLTVSQDLSNEQYTFKRIRPTELNIQHRKHVPRTLEEISSQEHDALVQKWAGCGLTIVSLLTENLLCHPFIVLRRQCQVHYSSWNYRLEPLSIIPVTIRLLQRQQASSLWKGVGSVLIVRGMTLAVEDVVSKFSPLSKEWTTASVTAFGQHLLLKCLSLAVTCPFYSASLVETVQSDIASERPGIFDVFRDGLCRILVWGSPQQGRMLPVWVLIVPTVVLGLLRYLINILVHKLSYAVITDYRDKQHTRWGAIPKNSDTDSEIEVTAGFTALVVSDVLLYPFETIWDRVLFSDETRVCLNSPDGRERVWRRRGERFTDACMSEREPYGGGSVMFWAGISSEGRTELVSVPSPTLNAERYVTDILEEHVVPLSRIQGTDFILMHDNARPHVAARVTQFLQEARIGTLPHPAISPDLNPIEHAWDMLKRRIRARDPAPATLPELEQAAKEEWRNIPQEMFRFGALVLQFVAHAAVIRITKYIISHVTALLRSAPQPGRQTTTPAAVKYTTGYPTPALPGGQYQNQGASEYSTSSGQYANQGSSEYSASTGQFQNPGTSSGQFAKPEYSAPPSEQYPNEYYPNNAASEYYLNPGGELYAPSSPEVRQRAAANAQARYREF